MTDQYRCTDGGSDVGYARYHVADCHLSDDACRIADNPAESPDLPPACAPGMHTWHVATACYNGRGELIRAGGMHVEARDPASAERAAIRYERNSWGSPRLTVECHVTHASPDVTALTIRA